MRIIRRALDFQNKILFLLMRVITFRFYRAKSIDYENISNKKLLIIRQGGIGDILFITPVLRELKWKYPSLKITIMTARSYKTIFRNYPFVDTVLTYSWLNVFNLFRHDYIVFLDKSLEKDNDAERINIYDLFSKKYFGLTLEDDNKRPVIFVKEDSAKHVLSRYPFLNAFGQRNIGIQIKSQSPVRTPSPSFFEELIVRLAGKIIDANIFLLIDRNNYQYAENIKKRVQTENGNVQIYNFGTHSRNVQDLIAIVGYMDIVIAPDSSVIHIAAGLDIPAVGIYGPFPSNLRAKYYSKTIAIDALYECAPCFTHGHKPCKKAKDVPFSPCFEHISLDDVVANSILLLDKVKENKNKRIHLNKYAEHKSETSKFRNEIKMLLYNLKIDLYSLNGVEIGSGGDPLIDKSICVDLEVPYSKCGYSPTHLNGDSRSLSWFKDESLEYIYSSHLFEDFQNGENLEILKEWTRVIKKDGVLIMLLPDQHRYLKACRLKKESPNEHHKINNFGPGYMENLLEECPKLEIVKIHKFWDSYPAEYNFLLIVKKI